MLLFIVGFFYTRSHYIDIFNSCNIAVDKDFLDGNRKTIIEAISRIKDQDKEGYKDVCKYVNLVSENFCPIYHTYGGALQYNNQPGCYIKGSRIIYINPSKEDTDDIIDQRAEAIINYANLSKNYWLGSD
ncbi:hypothetical protein A3J19_05395 [Candidatus Daviesbacteria bacterium RIFCSPLOWO2_02_FULL_41_8]|uniref:Uncharacterized protein n=2 Tax=Candidatus Daviesiibacteriota TaxID=1752718 RepID=A0A1F5NJ06_9BACT|nr:MAG: hypothetical protein A3D83_00820 [Candidatus Daviesbacteria bacterium RIFCSPHIGHO2_02_FULL_41_10]OGE77543.1 MAG: hypothetical protein A3J19_05395 [Candidatus Daviesbacteria bacterium RIFCSPLOWO2_02_FULL_41_8]